VSLTSRERLIAAAREARLQACARYSGFQVGAALEDAEGRIFAGVNVESSSYGLTCCAERTALFTALTHGAREFRAIAVATDAERLTPPCGACRQVLWDYCGDIEVILANLSGATEIHSLAELLPNAFDDENLR
jgi:cytidine deaminase